MLFITMSTIVLWTPTMGLSPLIKLSSILMRKSLTLSQIATLLVTRFLPDMWHMAKVCFRTTSYPQSIDLTARIFLLTYKTVQGRSFFTACNGRQNAINLEEDIKKIDDDGIFQVKKTGGGKHMVNFSTL